MRKDYITVQEDAFKLEQNGFIEEHWTRIWENQALDSQRILAVRGREEYQLMQPYLQRLSKGARVLDGGCGLGEWTLTLTQDGFEAHGVDISRKVCEKLASLYPQVSFLVGDIRNLAYPDDYFDVYFSWGTFEHFEEGLEQCFGEAMRVLKPGGLLFVSVPYYNERLVAFDKIQGSMQPQVELQRFYQWRLNKQELQEEFAKAGFQMHHNLAVHKHEGCRRYIHYRFGWNLNSFAHRMGTWFAGKVLRPDFVCHMLLGIGEKPANL